MHMKPFLHVFDDLMNHPWLTASYEELIQLLYRMARNNLQLTQYCKDPTN